MDKLIIPIENVGKVSDNYHSFDELYDHRCHLFIALMRSNHGISWRAVSHADGTMFPDWFIAGMNLPAGTISYHLPQWMWKMLGGCRITTLNLAPKWDGHTPEMVIERLAEWFGGTE